MVRKILKKGSKEAKLRMAKVRASIGKKTRKVKRKVQVSFKAKGKKISFRAKK